MSSDSWRVRLAEVIERSGRSDREISLSAKPSNPRKPKLGPGYVHSILKEGKDPTISNLLAICEAAGASIYYVLGGFDITPEREEFLRLLVEADSKDVDAVRRLLAAGRQRARTQEPPAE